MNGRVSPSWTLSRLSGGKKVGRPLGPPETLARKTITPTRVNNSSSGGVGGWDPPTIFITSGSATPAKKVYKNTHQRGGGKSFGHSSTGVLNFFNSFEVVPGRGIQTFFYRHKAWYWVICLLFAYLSVSFLKLITIILA
jgi:hypothetical protein